MPNGLVRFCAIRVLTCLAMLALLVSPAAAQTCFREWDGAPNGTNGTVSCMTSWDPDGGGPLTAVLVVGGSFTVVGNISANNIAYWDGAWHALGSGLNDSVSCLAVRNGDLIAGGGFTQSGAANVSYIGRWTGSAWQSLGSGVSAYVSSMAVNGSELYVGGNFQTVAGGLLASKYIARYNGLWHEYPDLGWGPVTELAYFNGQVVMACDSRGRTIGDVVMMQWNGTNNWNLISSCDTFGGMRVYGAHIYFSGYFFNSATPQHERHNIKRWNGATVDIVQNQVRVSRWGLDNGLLIALGTRYDDHDPTTAWNYTFNGTTWAPWANMPAPEPSGFPRCLHEHGNGTLFCGGNFSEINNVHTDHIAQLVGPTWEPLNTGLNALVRAATSYNGQLYIGGDFTSLGAVNATGIMRWDGEYWRAVPFSSMNAAVSTLFEFSSNTLTLPSLAIGGYFTSAGGTAANRIVLYDSFGDSWSALGTGLNGAPFAFGTIPGTQAFRNNLVVGGQFTQAGGVTVNRIARYVSGAWQGFGTGMNNEVRALARFQGSVVAGGMFTTANGVACNRIALWNGTTFVPLGSGVNNTIYAMQIFDSKLVVAGDFTTAGGAAANRVAQWDGATWQPMGAGFTNTVFSLKIVDNELVAAGFFTASGATSLGYMAQWNGTDWVAMPGGSGADSWVIAMAVNPSGTLVAGGAFSHMSGEVTPYVAVSEAPSTLAITTQPVAAAACAGDAANFHISTNGGIFSGTEFRWQRNFIDLVEGPTAHGSIIDGVHSSFLTIENAQPQDAGEYRCIASRCSQTQTSDSGPLTITPGPSITTQPSADGACQGQPFTLSVIASGVNPLTYAWFKDGTPVGQSSNLLFFPILGVADNGIYQCIISNGDGCGRSITVPAALNVQPCCAADFNEDGVVDFFDYLDFVQVFSVNDPIADFNNDAIVDFFDYLDFVQAFSQGC